MKKDTNDRLLGRKKIRHEVEMKMERERKERNFKRGKNDYIRNKIKKIKRGEYLFQSSNRTKGFGNSYDCCTYWKSEREK